MRHLSDLSPGFILFAVLGWLVTFLPALLLIGGHPQGKPYSSEELPGFIYTTLLFLVWALIWVSPVFSDKAKSLILSPQGRSKSFAPVLIVPTLTLVILAFGAAYTTLQVLMGAE